MNSFQDLSQIKARPFTEASSRRRSPSKEKIKYLKRIHKKHLSENTLAMPQTTRP